MFIAAGRVQQRGRRKRKEDDEESHRSDMHGDARSSGPQLPSMNTAPVQQGPNNPGFMGGPQDPHGNGPPGGFPGGGVGPGGSFPPNGPYLAGGQWYFNKFEVKPPKIPRWPSMEHLEWWVNNFCQSIRAVAPQAESDD